MTMSSQRSKTRNYHLLDANDNVKAKIQDKELSPVESSDAIDNVKAKIQDKGLSPVDLQIQLTMSRKG
jgi:hypothetical protein